MWNRIVISLWSTSGQVSVVHRYKYQKGFHPFSLSGVCQFSVQTGLNKSPLGPAIPVFKGSHQFPPIDLVQECVKNSSSVVIACFLYVNYFWSDIDITLLREKTTQSFKDFFIIAQQITKGCLPVTSRRKIIFTDYKITYITISPFKHMTS